MPRLRHRTRAIGCHRTRLRRSIAVRHGSMKLGYKAMALGCPSARPIARRHLVVNHFTLRVEGRGRVRERRAEPLPGRGPGAHRDLKHRHGSSWSRRHCTTRLSTLHGLDSSLHRYPLALNTDGEPRFFLCSPPDLAARPWRSTLGVCRPRPSSAAGNTRTQAHTRDHTVTTPPKPRSAPACLIVVFMIAVTAGNGNGVEWVWEWC